MNAPATPTQDIFDVRKIRRLVELMKEHDLSEIDLQQGEVRIQLRRAYAAAPTVVGVSHAAGTSTQASAGPPAPESVAPGAGICAPGAGNGGSAGAEGKAPVGRRSRR